MRRLLAAALIFLALGPVPGAQKRLPPPDTRSQRIAAHRLAFPAERSGALRFVGGWRLASPNRTFGGFSAMAVVAPGRFQLVSDSGVGALMTLNPDGRVNGVRIARLPGPGRKLRRKSQSDFEAMAVDRATGKAWVALEGLNQVWRLDAALTRIESRARLPKPRWPINSGPEAMARLADRRTLIFSEDGGDDPRGREALLFGGDPAVPGAKAIRFIYDAEGKGLVSDAAPLPDGRVLLVHRRLGFSPVFTTILATIDPADIRAGVVLRSRTIGRVPEPLAENYEGAAVEIRGGRTYLWLVSDDNFNGWQRTLLMQFELTGILDSKKAAP